MPRPRTIDDATLLAAAREVFVEKGPAATTREVAQRAGVSEGVLFQRYKTKADLFFAALAPPAADPTSILPSGEEAVGDRAALEEAALRMLGYFRETMPLLLPLVSHPSFDPERFFHHTAPVANIYGFREALRLIHTEGMPARFDRHQRAHNLLVSELDNLGISLFTPQEHRLPMLNVVEIPDGVEDTAVRAAMLDRGIEISGAFGPLAGKAWRIGLLGANATAPVVDRLVKNLTEVLGR